MGFTFLLLLLPSQLYLWGSLFFFFFSVPSSLGFTFLLLRYQLYLWDSPFFFIILLLLLRSQPNVWGSLFFFFCVPSHISGVHLSSSSSAFPAISLGFTFLLLLLRSQLYLWGSSFFFFFFCVPSYISGGHLFVRYLHMCPSFNPTVEEVPFPFRGWCMLSVILLPAFICLGHECQDLWSPCDGMHVCRD